MPPKKPKPALITVDQFDLYSLVIYQNDAFVEGLYQQLHETGLPQTAETEGSRESGTSASGTISGKAGVPVVGRIELDGAADHQRGRSSRISEAMSFTQAKYLYEVRKKLQEGQGVVSVRAAADVASLKPGLFVEFSATFEPNELTSIMDVMSPELAFAAAKSKYINDRLGRGWDLNELQAAAEGHAAIWFRSMEAVQRDFRNDKSREFYGRVRDEVGSEIGITAAVVCDTEFFGNQDADRILDGQFRVLGKVIQVSESGLSKLDRNKILKRISTQKVREWQDKLAELPFGESAEPIDADDDDDVDGTEYLEPETISDYVDLDLKLDVLGPAVKVIPVAIFI